MPVTVTILRPFTFSRPKGNGLALELKYAPAKDAQGHYVPTEIELPDDVARHPWIKESFADGHIESPAATKQRLEAAQKVRVEAQAAEDKIRRQAEDAYRRAVGGARIRSVNDEEVRQSLDTPINELARNRGADLTANPELERELETPLNKLGKNEVEKQLEQDAKQ